MAALSPVRAFWTRVSMGETRASYVGRGARLSGRVSAVVPALGAFGFRIFMSLLAGFRPGSCRPVPILFRHGMDSFPASSECGVPGTVAFKGSWEFVKGGVGLFAGTEPAYWESSCLVRLAEGVQHLAFVFEIESALDRVGAPQKALGQGGKGCGFVIEPHVAVVEDYRFLGVVIHEDDFFPGFDSAHAEPERAAAGGFLDFPGGVLVFNFVAFRLHALQAVRRAADFRDAFQQAIGIFGRHRVELLDALLAIEVFDGPQIRIQAVDDGMQVLVGQLALDIVDRIRTERERQGFAPVQLPEPLLQILRIPNLDVLRECRIRQDVDYAFALHAVIPFSFLRCASWEANCKNSPQSSV